MVIITKEIAAKTISRAERAGSGATMIGGGEANGTELSCVL